MCGCVQMCAAVHVAVCGSARGSVRQCVGQRCGYPAVCGSARTSVRLWCMAVLSCAHGSVLLSGSATVYGNAAVCVQPCGCLWQCAAVRQCVAVRAAV